MNRTRKQGGNGKLGVEGALRELPLLELPDAHPCHACGGCCRYIAIEIDNPTCFKDHDNIRWYLSHRGVSVYVDWEGDWFIEFETPCERLTGRETCGIYESRPEICAEFSWEECEKTTRERAWKHRFVSVEEFEQWHRERRPRSWDRYRKALQKLAARRQKGRERSCADPAAPEPREASPS